MSEPAAQFQGNAKHAKHSHQKAAQHSTLPRRRFSPAICSSVRALGKYGETITTFINCRHYRGPDYDDADR